MHPKYLSISDFDYGLPESRIAKYPLQQRDNSKLLIYKDKTIREDFFSNLDEHLPGSSLLIFNNTKVVEARLYFERSPGTLIEIFCLEPGESIDIHSGLQQTSPVTWKCFVGNARKWRDEILNKTFYADEKPITLTAKKIRKEEDHFLVEFSWHDDTITFAEALHGAGVIPLPPYLHRKAEAEDAVRYQTFYAKQEGSVAAPTAGLHFTPELFNKIRRKNIEIDFVTLHVGAGTFKPVKAESLSAHEMHGEYFVIKKEFVAQLLNSSSRNIIAVGTTTLRTLESLYWIGVKLAEQLRSKSMHAITEESFYPAQWDAYDLPGNISPEESLQTVLTWMNAKGYENVIAKTQMIIAPPYRLRIANALVTNFHQPRSTLLLLVAALVGPDWKRVYQYALENNFRFLSYGDGCLFFPGGTVA